MKDDYSRPARNTLTKNIDFHSDIMRDNVALSKNVIQPSNTQVWVKEVTKISNLTHKEPNNFCGQDLASVQPMRSLK